MKYKDIAKKAIANKHANAYHTKTAGKADTVMEGGSALLSYLKRFVDPATLASMGKYTAENQGRLVPGALVGAGMGGVGGFVTADGGRNMLTGQQYSPTMGQRMYSGLAGALGGGVVGAGVNFAKPAISKALAQASQEGFEKSVKDVGSNPKGPNPKESKPKGVWDPKAKKWYKDEEAMRKAQEQRAKAQAASEAKATEQTAKNYSKRPNAYQPNIGPTRPAAQPNIAAQVHGVSTNIPGDTYGVTPTRFTTNANNPNFTNVNMPASNLGPKNPEPKNPGPKNPGPKNPGPKKSWGPTPPGGYSPGQLAFTMLAGGMPVHNPFGGNY